MGNQSSSNSATVALAAVGGMAVGGLLFASLGKNEKVSAAAPTPDAAPALAPTAAPINARAKEGGRSGARMKPVVIASTALEPLAKLLSKRLGCKEFGENGGNTLYLEKFKSGDVNAKFNWERVIGRKVVMLFDTVDQTKFFEQLCVLQALQGFAVPDAEDKTTKWKTYVDSGAYSWGRASSITVVIPWYRPCQMERTSRWQLDCETQKWTNSDPSGEWLDVPCALYYARLLSTPGAVPPLPGPSGALDGMELKPLWRPPLELIFIELHEEKPVAHSVSDLETSIRTERYVPYFLDKYKSKKEYPGPRSMYVLFPDHGAHDRYSECVKKTLHLDEDHILYIQKSRVGESIEQVQKLFYEKSDGEVAEKTDFTSTDRVLILDDFTNSGGTLTGAVDLVKKKTSSEVKPTVHIFVSHLVATYDPNVVESLKKKLEALGDTCKCFVTNSIPLTTNLLKGHPQFEVCDLSDFIADLITKS